MSNLLRVTNNEGTEFVVRLVKAGDKYGLDWCLTHDEAEPMVEFYDARQDKAKFTEYGQFVSRYYLSTILEGTGGIQLDGGVPSWHVSAGNMEEVRAAFGKKKEKEKQSGQTAGPLIVTNDKGVSFRVNVIRQGDKYGLDNALTHKEEDPVVEFYDISLSQRGQMVSSYYVSTFNSINGGLDLHGGVDSWKLSASNVKEVQEYLKQ